MREGRLVGELAARDWSRGEHLEALVVCDQVLQDRYRVRGLDEDGHPRRADDILDAFSDPGTFGSVAVQGGHPECFAVRLYRAAGLDRSWFVVTPGRVAVLRLRDLQNTAEGSTARIVEEVRQQPSLGGALRGLGKIVKTSATEFAKDLRRPDLVERPQDAVLECPFEVPRNAVHSITRWKQPMVPNLAGGPRFVEVGFTDGSWARLQTDQPGATALTGPEG